MPATACRTLYVNWAKKILQISDRNGGLFSLPNFNKYETVPFKVYIVEDDNSAGISQFNILDISSLSLSMAINQTFDSASPLAQQLVWAKQDTLNFFYAELPLNTAALNAYLGASSTKDAYLEIEMQEGTARSKILTQSITLQNAVTQVGSITPVPADEYFTKAQTAAQFWGMIGAPGSQLTITSPGNVYQRILGVDDGGAPIDIILPV